MRLVAGLFVLAAAAVGACLLRIMIDRPPDGTLGLAWPDHTFDQYRFTATAVGAIVGVALAIAGVLLQVLMRNPLASPFLLGISSGAGLGVMISIWLSVSLGVTWLGGSRVAPALVGAGVALVIVYLLGQRRGLLDPVTLILVGVIVATIASASTLLLQHLVPADRRGDLVTWTMGKVPETIETGPLALATVVVLVGLAVSTWLGRAMDAATLSDHEARSVGVSLGPFRVGLYLLAGVLTATAVAIAGPIGFVGLICPHAARIVLGPKHRAVVIGAALAGIALVVGADTLRQGIDMGSGRMPVGIFTAMFGGVAFLWLLRAGGGRP